MFLSRVATCTAVAVALGVGSAYAGLLPGTFVGVDFDNGGNTPGSGSAGTGIFVVEGLADGGGLDGTAIVAVEALSPTISTATDGTDLSGTAGGGVGVAFDITTVSATNMRFGEQGESAIGFRDADPGNDFSALPVIDETLTNDGFFTNGSIGLTFSNLDPSLSYNVYVLNASTAGEVPNNNLITATVGATSATGGDLEAGNLGVLTPIILTGLFADGSGNLTVTIADASNPVSSSGFFGLAGVVLEANPIPEPSTVALFGGGLIALAMIRRRK